MRHVGQRVSSVQRLDLPEEHARIDDDPLPDHVSNRGAQNARRDQVQDGLLTAHNQRMAIRWLWAVRRPSCT